MPRGSKTMADRARLFWNSVLWQSLPYGPQTAKDFFTCCRYGWRRKGFHPDQAVGSPVKEFLISPCTSVHPCIPAAKRHFYSPFCILLELKGQHLHNCKYQFWVHWYPQRWGTVSFIIYGQQIFQYQIYALAGRCPHSLVLLWAEGLSCPCCHRYLGQSHFAKLLRIKYPINAGL